MAQSIDVSWCDNLSAEIPTRQRRQAAGAQRCKIGAPFQFRAGPGIFAGFGDKLARADFPDLCLPWVLTACGDFSRQVSVGRASSALGFAEWKNVIPGHLPPAALAEGERERDAQRGGGCLPGAERAGHPGPAAAEAVRGRARLS